MQAAIVPDLNLVGIHDPDAYTITAIKNCRRRFFPFLWSYLDRHDLMWHVRSLAWLILAEDRPETKRELYNAVQRRLYREAKNDGWHRERRGMKYAQRVIAESDLPGTVVGES